MQQALRSAAPERDTDEEPVSAKSGTEIRTSSTSDAWKCVDVTIAKETTMESHVYVSPISCSLRIIPFLCVS